MTAGRALLRLLAAPYKPRAGVTLAGPKMLPDDADNDTKSECHNQQFHASLGVPCTSAFRAAAVAMVVLLSACADKPIPPVNSYCVVKATERIDMRDPGLQGLWPSNQGAVLTGDDNFRQLCQRTNSPGGPR